MDFDLIPIHMHEGIKRYLEDGILPGDFLMAVLCNKFVDVVCLADSTNKQHLQEWAWFMHNEMPMNAWGSEAKVLAYMQEIREKLIAKNRQEDNHGRNN